MSEKLINYLKEKPIIIPRVLLTNYSKLNITAEELIILIYLMDKGNNIIYDINLFVKELSFTKRKVIELINNLVEKNIINITINKNSDNVSEEYLNLDMLYRKITNIILDKELPSSTNNEDLFTIFEKEFGRTISPTEYEKINSWLNEDIDKTLIVEALKEAVYNSTTSLRYIETILYSLKKKGIKTKEDVNKERIRYKKSKNEVIEVPDFDWVNNE